MVADVWRGLPLADRCADLLLDVFAPRNAADFRRVLTPQGRLLIVWPTQRHLQELVKALDLLTVDEAKEERLHRTLASQFTLVSTSLYEEQLALTLPEIALLARMGPSAHHLTQADLSPGRLAERLADQAAECRARTDLTAETDLTAAPDFRKQKPLSAQTDGATPALRCSVTVSVTLAEYAPAGER